MVDSIQEFVDKVGRDCDHSYTGRMYKIVVCGHNPDRHIMCCDSICPLRNENMRHIDREPLNNAIGKTVSSDKQVYTGVLNWLKVLPGSVTFSTDCKIVEVKDDGKGALILSLVGKVGKIDYESGVYTIEFSRGVESLFASYDYDDSEWVKR